MKEGHYFKYYLGLLSVYLFLIWTVMTIFNPEKLKF